MRSAILFIALLLNQITLLAQDQGRYKFTLTGTIRGMDSGFVYINYIPNGERGILDSSRVNSGHFVLNGTVTEPTKAWFSTVNLAGPANEGNLTQFYIEPGDLKLYATIDHLKDMELIGSSSDNDRKKLDKLEEHVISEIHSVDSISRNYDKEYRIEKRNGSDSSRLKFIKQKEDSTWAVWQKLYRKVAQIDSLFIIENPDSYVAADILSNSNVSWIAFPSLDSLYSKFPDYIKQSFPGKKIKLDIDRGREIPIGGYAKDFLAIDSKGDTIGLTNYKTKKYVLLDFGASWCGPCRAIIPELKKYYAKYNFGFEIVSIAQQDEIDDWRKAIKDDKMEWPQIIENKKRMPIKPSNSSISDMYYVSTIPSLILIDKNMKIVGKYGGFYYSNATYLLDLEQKLNEIFR